MATKYETLPWKDEWFVKSRPSLMLEETKDKKEDKQCVTILEDGSYYVYPTKQPEKDSEGLPIHTRVQIAGITAINESTQTVEAIFDFTFWWSQEKEPEMLKDAVDRLNPDKPHWNPQFKIHGLVDMKVYMDKFWPNDGREGRRRWELRLKCSIMGKMQFKHFPFDVQKLRLRMDMSEDSDTCYFAAPRSDAICEYDLSTDHLTNFDVHPEFPIASRIFKTSVQQGKGKDRKEVRYSALEIRLYFVRNPRFVILNFVFILGLIVTVSLCAWFTPASDLGGRYDTDMVALLTAVAMKLVINDMLPPWPHWMFMDYYTMGCFIFLSTQTVTHGILFTLGDFYDGEALQETCNYICWIVFLSLWVIFNLVFAIQCAGVKKTCRDSIMKKNRHCDWRYIHELLSNKK